MKLNLQSIGSSQKILCFFWFMGSFSVDNFFCQGKKFTRGEQKCDQTKPNYELMPAKGKLCIWGNLIPQMSLVSPSNVIFTANIEVLFSLTNCGVEAGAGVMTLTTSAPVCLCAW